MSYPHTVISKLPFAGTPYQRTSALKQMDNRPAASSYASPGNPPAVRNARFGTGGVLAPILWTMAKIDSNKITELAVTDLAGYVIPRTTIETLKRGGDAGREVGFREITATFINVFVSGWLAYPALKWMQGRRNNPQGVNFNAHIDAALMNHFEKTIKKLLPKAESAQALQQQFLKSILSRIQSSDPIYQVPSMEKFYPSKGKLTPEGFEMLQTHFLGKGGTGKGPFTGAKYQQHIAKQLNSAENRQKVIEAAEAAKKAFLARHGTALTSAENLQLRQVLANTTRDAQRAIGGAIGRSYFGRLKALEKPFVEAAGKAAVDVGGLSEKVLFLDKAGYQVQDLGVRSLEDTLLKTHRFLTHYLNRAISNPNTGEVTNAPLSSAFKSRIYRRLFAQGKAADGVKTWWQRKMVPQLADGLLPYTYKSKFVVVMPALFLTLVSAVSIAWINNYITRRKYKGTHFFPGEGIPEHLKHLEKARIL